MAFSGFGNSGYGGTGALVSSGYHQDCINHDDQNIAASGAGSVSCSVTGVAVNDTGLEAVLADVRTSNGTTGRTNFNGFGNMAETVGVSFNMDTIFSALVSHP